MRWCGGCDRAGDTIAVPGRVGFPAVGALSWRDLTAGEYRAVVALLWAYWVRASVFGLPMM